MANYTNLKDLFTAMANAIRLKKGDTGSIVADNFPTEISNLKTGFDYMNNSVTALPDYAFYGCEDLNSVDCYSLTSVGESAFEKCGELEEVFLWGSVETVGENAFKDCPNVYIYCEADSKPDGWSENWNPDERPVDWMGGPVNTWDISATENDNVTAKMYNPSRNGLAYPRLYIHGVGAMKDFNYNTTAWDNAWAIVLVSGMTSIGNYAFNDCTNLTSITIPDSVTSIGKNAFNGCSKLSSITIPDSVTSIGDSAFSSCTSLSSITIPDSVTSIGDHAFFNCDSLTSITIPDSVTSIGERAFKNCTSLTSITIPDSVTSIGDSAFYSTAFYNESSNWTNGVLYIDNHLIEATGTISGSYIIKYGTVTIGNNAFEYCRSLTSITIPDSVTSIGLYAFSSCTSLSSITIPDSVTSIGHSSFGGTPWLTAKQAENPLVVVNGILIDGTTCSGDITIPDSVTSIGNYAFFNCDSLTSITIPDSVTSIGERAFFSCDSLTSITYTGTMTQWNAITFGSSWNNNTGSYTVHCTDGDIAKA